jgi:hypothetical protein
LVTIMALDEFTYSTPENEIELADILEGHRVGLSLPWPSSQAHLRSSSSAVVLCRDDSTGEEPLRPIVLVLRPEELQRFFGRYSQLRGDLSPISTWCHVVAPRAFESLHSLDRAADLNGFEAAWTGLVVAEALILAERPLSQIRIAACFSTHSYAIARAVSLWPNLDLDEVIDKYDQAQSLLRGPNPKPLRLRQSLTSIWNALLQASKPEIISHRGKHSVLAESIRALELARRHKDPDESSRLVEPLEHLVENGDIFRKLSKLSPEQRLNQFDKLVSLAEKHSAQDSAELNAILLLAGYLATVVAGGSASLSMVEASSQRWPQITAWAYILGSIGEKVVWTSSFDGLGRLVARDLLRPLRLSEAPTCDFSLDEALVLVDPQLSDPFVHLRIKQSRIVTVSLFPGVNISLPFVSDMNQENQAVSPNTKQMKRPVWNEELADLANSLWPYLREIMVRNPRNTQRENDTNTQRPRNQKRGSSQSKLPLK